MRLKIPAGEIFFKDYGWHSGHFHFSFGDYVDSHNKGFGVLVDLNDFILNPIMALKLIHMRKLRSFPIEYMVLWPIKIAWIMSRSLGEGIAGIRVPAAALLTVR